MRPSPKPSADDALPGELQVDGPRLEASVATLNSLAHARGLDAALRIGAHLVDTWFGGDVRNFRSRGRRHASFRALAGRADLLVSYTALWYAVGVLEQVSELPHELARTLPLSHHRLLLSVRDPRAKLRLAREAVAAGDSKRDLEDRIRDLRATSPRRKGQSGRPPLPDLVKGLRQVRKSVRLATRQSTHSAALEGLSPELMAELLRALGEDLGHLQGIADALRQGLARHAAATEAAQAAK